MTEQTPVPIEPAPAAFPPAQTPDGAEPNPFAPPPEPPPGAVLGWDAGLPAPRRGPRRALRALLRWTAAVLVFAALGGATAYAVTLPRRTDLPGLRTPDDGRWRYPKLALPRLPEGAPRPLATDNVGGRHYADPRALLLPVPAGARADRAFPGANGWLPTATFLRLYEADDRKLLGETLTQDGLRHIAARAWTAPDGTRAEIYLLQFLTAPYATAAQSGIVSARLTEAPELAADDTFAAPVLPLGASVNVYAEDKPYGSRQVREGYVMAGDTVAVIVLSHPGPTPAVPFRQTVTLQSELLG